MLEQLKEPKVGEEVAVLKTNRGDIKIRLFEEAAPKAVENFKGLIENGYYDTTVFHRVIENFMIQGGDPTATGMGGESLWGKSFKDEFSDDYRNVRGALSMANAGPNTNGSQFFIVQMGPVEEDVVEQMKELGEAEGFSNDVIDAYESFGGTFWLDGKHSVFGQVYEGMDVVDEIASVQVDFRDKPLHDVVIESAELIVVE